MSKRWREQTDVKFFRDLLKLDRFNYDLESEPLTPDDVIVNIEHRKIINGEAHPKYYYTFNFHGFDYELDRGKPCVVVDFPKLCESLERNGVKEDMEVTITVAYIEK